MSNTFKYLDDDNKQSSNDDVAQSFLNEKLSKNKYTIQQQASLDASGGSSVVNASDGVVPVGEAYSKYGKIPGAKSTTSFVGGGTERYADYTNSNKGQTAFTDTWQDGAKYQQLRGSGALTNKDFDAQFASAKGGQDTGTVADDGGGWKLIKTDSGDKTNERKLEYKDVASQWQSAGYDVRVQDHNPDFDGGTGEIAVRVGQAKSTEAEPEKERTPIEHSPEVKQATERVRAYEDNVMSGKTSEDIFGSYDTGLDLNASEAPSAQATPTEQAPAKATASFLESKKSDYKQAYNFKPKTDTSYGAN